MDEFLLRTFNLLRLERDAEKQKNELSVASQLHSVKTLEDKGLCIQKLHVSSQRVGLYGRQVAVFERAHRLRQQQSSLPSSSISTGCIVVVFANSRRVCEDQLSGVVVRSSHKQVHVAFDDLPPDVDFNLYSGCLQLVKTGNHVTYNRMKAALERLRSSHLPAAARHLAQVLFAEVQPMPPSPALQSFQTEESPAFGFVNESLDPSQRKAVLFALAQPELALIHGPPGTGKTTTLIEVILQAVKGGTKVLACAPSNIAVDNLAERLAARGIKVVRVGHPARLVGAVLDLSLDARLAHCDSAAILKDIKQELELALVKRGKSRDASDRRRWGSEIKALRKELKDREEKALQQLLGGADVVLATTTGSSLDGPLGRLSEDHFGLTVIDECAQAIEASCWVPLVQSSKCVLAGDHKQLPPTIISQEAAGKGLSTSLMERLVAIYGDSVTSMLTTQYRMNRHIMQWPSEKLYGGLLEPHPSVAGHTLADLGGVSSTCDTIIPLVLIDTAGLDLRELDTLEEESKGNEGEADLVVHHVKSLLEAGVRPSDVAVIAPYNLQVELIRQRLHSLDSDLSQLEVKSVDGFQGREKEAVVISFTRSNPAGEFGFLEEVRRTNVAVTRARRHLALVGDSVTLGREPFLKGLLDYCSTHGEVRSAHEYLHASGFEERHLYESKKSKTSSGVHDWKKGSKAVSVSYARPTKRVTSKSATGSATFLSLAARLSSEELAVELEEFKRQLQDFMKDEPRKELVFPSSLTGRQRKRIHELCECEGLAHRSRGEGADRHMVVTKERGQELSGGGHEEEVGRGEGEGDGGGDDGGGVRVMASARDVLSVVEDGDQGSSSESELESEPVRQCPSCGGSVPTANFTTHQAHCSHAHASSIHQARSSHAHTISSSTSSKPTAKKKSRKKARSEAVEEDVDALLAEMSVSDERCGHTGCKRKPNLIGLRCSLCRRMFCVEHSIPEVHGCGQAAKARAQREFKKPTATTGAARELAHRRLGKKITKLSSERKAKAKSK